MRPLKRILKGGKGEKIAKEKISEMLLKLFRDSSDFILIHQLPIALDYEKPNEEKDEPWEVDLLVASPLTGIKILEVKNFDNPDPTNIKKAINQAKSYKDLILGILQDKYPEDEKKIKKLLSYLIVFPSIEEKEYDEKINSENFRKLKSFIIFKDDLEDFNKFQKKMVSKKLSIAEDLKEIIELLKKSLLAFLPEDYFKKKSFLEERLPIITKHGIAFIDKMQINTLKDYKGGLRIIRGVAGTGKTIMATSLAKAWSKKGKILFLVFNREIYKNIKAELKDYKNIDLQKLLSLVKCDIDDLKTGKKENYIRYKLKKYLEASNPELIIVDEAQDFPPYALKELRDNAKNIVVFIDESQAIYPFSTTNLKDAFPEDLRGKVRNLRTIYRVPERIFSLALQILNNDKSLNKYFKEIGLELSQSNSILEGGIIRIKEGKVDLTDYKDYTILSKTGLNVPNLNTYTYESVKGLEFDKAFLYDIGSYIDAVLSNESEKKLIWRKLYVAITRTRNELVIHNSTYSEEINEILNALISNAQKFIITEDKNNITPSFSKAKSILFDLAKEILKEFIIRSLPTN